MIRPPKNPWPAWADYLAVTVIGLALAVIGAMMI